MADSSWRTGRPQDVEGRGDHRPFDPTAATHQQAPGGIAHETGELHRLLVESVDDYAIFALDQDGYILSWNAGAHRIKGYTADEAIGKHFSIFYPRDKIEQGFPQFELKEAARVGRFEDEGWRIRKDGTRFWANVVITALFKPDGSLAGFAKVTRDLTERRAAEERAIEAARKAAVSDEANRTKSQFLAAMSHELRTPLNAIGGYTDLLAMGLRGPVTEAQLEDLQRINRSQRHLLGIINDILNFSRIEAGQTTYDYSTVPLSAVMEAVGQMIEPQAAAKGIELEVHECPVEVAAWTDKTKVEQILINLLSNAVKFTEQGRVTLECDSHDAQRVSIEVTDTGVGIPADHLERIFEPFVQVGRSLTQSQEGTGLGLAISRDLARGMSGDIVVTSEPQKGSRFKLILPRTPSA